MSNRKNVEKALLLICGILLILLGLGVGFLLSIGIYDSWGRPREDIGIDAQPELAILYGSLVALAMLGSGVYLVVGVFRSKRP